MSAIRGTVDLERPHAENGTVTVVADARLDERDELARELGVRASSTSDAELIRLAYERWQDDCVDRLLGDFAFVVTDGRARRTVAARDPLGVKPLHYHLARGRLTYATDVHDLFRLGVPRVIDEGRVADALVPELEGVDAQSTFFEGVRRLPAGHRLVIHDGHARLERTWRPNPSFELRQASDGEYAEAFLAIFRQSVRCRLDDRTASMLSGGLDSSAIVGVGAMLRRELGGEPLTTVSAVSGPGATCEETSHVHEMIRASRVEPILVGRDEVGVWSSTIDDFLAGGAEPFDGTMIVPVLMYAAARRSGARAVLDGVDGDAVLSLEPDYLDALVRAGAWGTALREARGVAGFYRGAAGSWPAPHRLLWGSARRALMPWRLRAAARRARRVRENALALQRSVIHPDFAARIGIDRRFHALEAHRAVSRVGDPRVRQAEWLIHPYIASALERYHRAAASQGIEARHPFLDRRLVEFGLALPWNQKVRGGWTKWIVRRAMEGILPDSVRWRRGRWVRLGPAFLEDAIAARTQRLEETFADTMSALKPFVDLVALNQVKTRFAATRDAFDGEVVWRAAHLARWLHTMSGSGYDAAASRVGAAPLYPLTPEGTRERRMAIQHDDQA